MNNFALAWRNVWRNRRRSLVTVGAMSFALFAMICYAALIEGYLLGMERNLLDLEVGDVQVYDLEYRDEPSLYNKIEDSDAVLGRLDEAGLAASGRVLGAGLAAAGENSAGVSFRGVDVERDRGVSLVAERIREGRWLDPTDPGGVVLGSRLARILGVSIGDDLVVLGQAADGSMANEVYSVRGILSSVSDAVDRTGVYMTVEAFRELMVLPEGVHQLIVRREPGRSLHETSAAVKAVAGDLEVKTWRELMPVMASLLDTSRGGMMVMFTIINLAIGIVILNAMLMAVFERIRELGVLKALGVGPTSIMAIILLEVGAMTGISVALGTLVSLPMLWYLSVHGIDLSASMSEMTVGGIAFDPIWRAQVLPATFAMPITVLVIIVGLATLYPALRAAYISPVEAMRHR